MWVSLWIYKAGLFWRISNFQKRIWPDIGNTDGNWPQTTQHSSDWRGKEKINPTPSDIQQRGNKAIGYWDSRDFVKIEFSLLRCCKWWPTKPSRFDLLGFVLPRVMTQDGWFQVGDSSSDFFGLWARMLKDARVLPQTAGPCRLALTTGPSPYLASRGRKWNSTSGVSRASALTQGYCEGERQRERAIVHGFKTSWIWNLKASCSRKDICTKLQNPPSYETRFSSSFCPLLIGPYRRH